MWCTRWYLPLVLLPLPIAPPYFLALFLFSTTLHAKPCFYCIILLTSLFMASCYWPPVPIDTPLDRPWSDNITTFAEALISRMPNLPLEMIPPTIQIADRCWCDFSEGFFEPYNTTQWEVNSVEGLKRHLEKQMREKVASEQTNVGMQGNASTLQGEIEQGYKAFSSSFKNIWDKINLSSYTLPTLLPNSTTVEYEETLHEEPSALPPTTPAPSASPSASAKLQSLSSPWKEYDLRSYGFDMVIDLRWPS
ncbi:hypothetical protein BDY19DRAFT_941826 [Irpex rosettiformis]|uniref:Uncharacterized protein n=1 Tax=Irpex rosettiformis TaxID=378272 RepID=A0ACB8U6M3_9APHY|nr:hypothetical protein BDY19DRAFT_941826 [Irpex rosettiformis]